MFVPYKPNKCCKKGGKQMTPHHVVPVADLSAPRKKGETRGERNFQNMSTTRHLAFVRTVRTTTSVARASTASSRNTAGSPAAFAKKRNDALKGGKKYNHGVASEAGALPPRR